MSDHALEELEPKHEKFAAADREARRYKEESRPIRDAQMASKARTLRSPDAINLMLVGSNHLPGIRDQLRDQPCVFMKPKKITQVSLRENPARKAGEAYKKEL